MLFNVLGLHLIPASSKACLLQDYAEDKQPAYVKCFEFFGKPVKEYTDGLPAQNCLTQGFLTDMQEVYRYNLRFSLSVQCPTDYMRQPTHQYKKNWFQMIWLSFIFVFVLFFQDKVRLSYVIYMLAILNAFLTGHFEFLMCLSGYYSIVSRRVFIQQFQLSHN